MTQRALVERSTSPGNDDYGNPQPSAWATHLAALPCWLYGSTEKEAVTEERAAVVTDLKLMVPLGSDITEQDRIASVKNRKGDIVHPGVLEIDTVLYKRSHLQLAVTRVSG